MTEIRGVAGGTTVVPGEPRRHGGELEEAPFGAAEAILRPFADAIERGERSLEAMRGKEGGHPRPGPTLSQGQVANLLAVYQRGLPLYQNSPSRPLGHVRAMLDGREPAKMDLESATDAVVRLLVLSERPEIQGLIAHLDPRDEAGETALKLVLGGMASLRERASQRGGGREALREVVHEELAAIRRRDGSSGRGEETRDGFVEQTVALAGLFEDSIARLEADLHRDIPGPGGARDAEPRVRAMMEAMHEDVVATLTRLGERLARDPSLDGVTVIAALAEDWSNHLVARSKVVGVTKGPPLPR